MEHLLLKAATTAVTDEGTFTAVISTASVDRDKDIIEPAGMVASLSKCAALGKMVPLAWNHTDEFNAERGRTGIGVGLRWLLPAVFELRTDVAMGEDGKVFFHLGVGDKLTAQRARLR